LESSLTDMDEISLPDLNRSTPKKKEGEWLVVPRKKKRDRKGRKEKRGSIKWLLGGSNGVKQEKETQKWVRRKKGRVRSGGMEV